MCNRLGVASYPGHTIFQGVWPGDEARLGVTKARAHVTHRLTDRLGVIKARSGRMMPQRTVRSRHSAPSPAMLPSAHTAWSTTFICSEDSSCTNRGTAPAWQRKEKVQSSFICQQVLSPSNKYSALLLVSATHMTFDELEVSKSIT